MKIEEIKARWQEIKRQRNLQSKAAIEREKFLKWAKPELERVNAEKYRTDATEKLVKSVHLYSSVYFVRGRSKIISQASTTNFPKTPSEKNLTNVAKAREIKVTRQRETKNSRILSLLERKLTTQEPLTKNDRTLIRLAKLENEEIRFKFLELAKKDENKNSEAAYLVGKNPTAKRYLTGRFKGMLDNGLYIWVYENKDYTLSRGLLNTTLQEPKYSDPRSEITARQKISARTEIMIMLASWEAFEKDKAKEFNIYKHSNETALRAELVNNAEEEFNQTNEVIFYLGQNKTIATPQNIRKLIEWAMKNPNHYFARGLGLNPGIFLYKDINKLGKWAEEKENQDTLLAKSIREQINKIMEKTDKKPGISTTKSLTETIICKRFLFAESYVNCYYCLYSK